MDNRLHLSTLRGRRQEDHSCAGTDMVFEIRTPGESARALEHEVDAQFLPREIQRVASTQRPYSASANDQVVVVNDHGSGIAPVHGVVPKQVSQIVNAYQVVHRDELE